MADSKGGVKNIYTEFRSMALSTTPKDIGLKFPEDKTVVFGVVMEMGYEEGTASMIAYQTGDASLYYSTGGGFINGGSDREINRAARELISLAQTFAEKAKQTETTELPKTNEVNFFLLTNKGVLLGKDSLGELETRISEWSPLFLEGNKVMREMQNRSTGN